MDFHIGNIESEFHRVSILELLLPYISFTQLKELLKFITNERDLVRLYRKASSFFKINEILYLTKFTDSEDREQIIEDLIRIKSSKQSLKLALSIQNEPNKSRALAQACLQLPPNKALEIARKIVDKNSLSRSLVKIAARLPVENQKEIFEEAINIACSIEDSTDFNLTLIAIIPRLPIKYSYELVHLINDDYFTVQALISIIPRLPEGEIYQETKRAIDLAKSIKDNYQKYQSIMDILPFLDIKSAYDLAKRIEIPSYRSQSLAQLAKRVPADFALEIARLIDDFYLKARVITDIAQLFPKNEQALLLNEAVDIARKIDNQLLYEEALINLIPVIDPSFLPSIWDDAMKNGSVRVVDTIVKRWDDFCEVMKLSGNEILYKSLYEKRYSEREEFFLHLRTIIPVIHSLGGNESLFDLAKAIQISTDWWN